MAKVGTVQSGYVGKLNGQVYYKGADGNTVVRANTTPKNPKTLAQRVQRVIAKSVNAHYKLMKTIVDHSFEGRSMGFESMNRFKQANMKKLRARAYEIQQAGESLYNFYNFMPLGSEKFMPAAVIVSEGQLDEVKPSIVETDSVYYGKLTAAANTYQGIINAVGGARGDQMTLLTVEKLDGEYKCHHLRIILDPRNEDGSSASLSTEFITDGAINKPSYRNDGNFNALSFDGGMKFKLSAGSVCGVAIIMSRRSGQDWLRSNAKIVLSEAAIGSDLTSLMDAATAEGTTVLDLESELYLNNAGTGGAQGTAGESESGSVASAATINTSATFNGVSQSISGGSVAVTAPLTSIVITGTNLQLASLKLTKSGTTDAVTPVLSEGNTVATFSEIGGLAGETWNVTRVPTGGYTDETLVVVSVESGGPSGVVDPEG